MFSSHSPQGQPGPEPHPSVQERTGVREPPAPVRCGELRPQSPAALRGPRRDVVVRGQRGVQLQPAPPHSADRAHAVLEARRAAREREGRSGRAPLRSGGKRLQQASRKTLLERGQGGPSVGTRKGSGTRFERLLHRKHRFLFFCVFFWSPVYEGWLREGRWRLKGDFARQVTP